MGQSHGDRVNRENTRVQMGAGVSDSERVSVWVNWVLRESDCRCGGGRGKPQLEVGEGF